MNKQGNLNEFFDVSAGSGTYAPRKRQAYTSKRLQQVVSEFRNEKAKSKASQSPTPAGSDAGREDSTELSDAEVPAKKRRKTGKPKANGDTVPKKAPPQRGRGRGAKLVATRKNKSSVASQATADSDDGDGEFVADLGDGMGSVPKLRPRPKPKSAPLRKSAEGPEFDTDTET